MVVADRDDVASAVRPDLDGSPAGGRRPSLLGSWRRSSYRVQLLIITVVGAVLRLVLLGSLPLWRDEAFTAIVVQRPLGQMLSAVGHDSAPPLSYLLQHLVIQLWDSPTMLRLPSAVAGIVAIPLAAALGRRLAGDRAALGAAAAMALLPSSVLESRDARTYALATALVLASLLCLWRAIEVPSWRRVLLYGLVVAAAVYTNYFVVLAVGAQLAAAAWIFRDRLRTLVWPVVAAASAGLLLIPWLYAARAQLQHGSAGYWIQPVGLPSLSGVAIQFFAGPPIDPGVPGQLGLEVLQGLVVVAGVLALGSLVVRRRALSASGRRGAALLALSVGVGVVLLVAVSVWHPLVDARYVSVMWGPFVCLIGVGLALLPRPAWRGAALLVLGLGSAVLAVAPTKPDTPALVARIDGRVGAHDFVWTAPGEYLLIVHYANEPVVARTHVVAAEPALVLGNRGVPARGGRPARPRGRAATPGAAVLRGRAAAVPPVPAARVPRHRAPTLLQHRVPHRVRRGRRGSVGPRPMSYRRRPRRRRDRADSAASTRLTTAWIWGLNVAPGGVFVFTKSNASVVRATRTNTASS